MSGTKDQATPFEGKEEMMSQVRSPMKTNTTTTTIPLRRSPRQRTPTLPTLTLTSSETTKPKSFDEMLTELAKFKSETGHCKVPTISKSNPRLGNWVHYQRGEYHRRRRNLPSTMTTARVRALEELGFVWTADRIDNETWIKRYRELIEFSRREGHCRVPKGYPANPALAEWVVTQRKGRKKVGSAVMTEERGRLLDEIGFEWAPRRSPDEAWNNRYEHLKAFKVDEGHCNVPRSVPGLGIWVKRQRDLYRRKMDGKDSCLTKERIEALERIGFEWSTRHRNDVLAKVMQIRKFKFVKAKVKVTRRKLPLNVRKVDAVDGSKDEVGSELWMIFYKQLVEFRSQEGHCNVPSNCEKHANLYKWVQNQRTEYGNAVSGRESSLTKEHLNLLVKINFTWHPRPAKTNSHHAWDCRYEELRLFKAAHGHCNVPRCYERNPSLGTWVHNMRQAYRKLKVSGTSTILTEERLGLLEELGFVFRQREKNKNDAWLMRYRELKEFKKTNGHCRVDYLENRRLVRWMNKQRRELEKTVEGGVSEMTKEKIKALKKIGFDWRLRT